MMTVPVCFVDTNLFVRYLTNDDKHKCEFSDYINAKFLIILSDNRIFQII